MRQHITTQLLLFFLSIILAFFNSSCSRPELKFKYNEKLICKVDTIDVKTKKIVSDNPFISFGSSKLRSDKESFSGKYSVLLHKTRTYGLGVNFDEVTPDDYYEVSVWKKGHSDHGILVASGPKASIFYATERKTIEEKNGWSKIYLSFFIPPSMKGHNLSIYCWNPEDKAVYFDDLTITKYKEKVYPDYSEPALRIYIDSLEILKLESIRSRAFKAGVLEVQDDDWVPAIIFYGEEMMKAQLRLKGDWLDHLEGKKWSFRIKMKKGGSWKNMRTFSVQNPIARNFIDEWIAHKIFEQEDVLTTRYGFIPLILNGKSLGIYAYEEHFDKQIVEAKNRREGPIVKFSEDPFWVTQKVQKQSGKKYSMPIFEASVIEPFKKNRTLKSEALFNQFKIASNLMWEYKNNLTPFEDIFNINLMARYYALLDLTKGYHGMVWHNQRFYYNPVTCRLEQITFDNYTEYGVTKYADGAILGNFAETSFVKNEKYYMLTTRLFGQKEFVDKYIYYLNKYADPDFIFKIMESRIDEIDSLEKMIQAEFPEYVYDRDFLINNAKAIIETLPKYKKRIIKDHKLQEFFIGGHKKINFNTEFHEDFPELYVKVFIAKSTGDSAIINVYNYYTQSIIPIGTAKNKKRISTYFPPDMELMAFTHSYDTADFQTIITKASAKYLFFMVKDHDRIFTTAINAWPHPIATSPRQELLSESDFPNSSLYQVSGNRVVFKAGYHSTDKFVIIPKGYNVEFEAGCQLILNNHAGFISFSPVQMKGTQEKPVIIKSDDGSANGFTIIEPNGKSEIEFVEFNNLNTLNYKGWTHTGATTFYEADVKFDNCKFLNNNCEDALNIIRSDFLVENCFFNNIFSDAFDSDFCTGQVLNVDFSDIGNDAIDFSGSQIEIRDCEISYAGDKGISGGEASTLFVYNTHVRYSNMGFAAKDNSVVHLFNSNCSNCNYGLVALQKKPEYGPGYLITENLRYSEIKKLYLIEERSRLILNGDSIAGTEKELATKLY